MPERPKPNDRLFTTRWVHLFEQDSPEGEVYAPEDGPIPLSRRPRERLELKPDGTAVVFGPGPDDRPSPSPARWTEDARGVVVRPERGGAALRIVERTPTRLVIQRAAPRSKP
jgi:hypothetical protein